MYQAFNDPTTTSWSGLNLWHMLAKGPSIEQALEHYLALLEALCSPLSFAIRVVYLRTGCLAIAKLAQNMCKSEYKR